jgi:hypothetical protein
MDQYQLALRRFSIKYCLLELFLFLREILQIKHPSCSSSSRSYNSEQTNVDPGTVELSTRSIRQPLGRLKYSDKSTSPGLRGYERELCRVDAHHRAIFLMELLDVLGLGTGPYGPAVGPEEASTAWGLGRRRVGGKRHCIRRHPAGTIYTRRLMSTARQFVKAAERRPISSSHLALT